MYSILLPNCQHCRINSIPRVWSDIFTMLASINRYVIQMQYMFESVVLRKENHWFSLGNHIAKQFG